MKKSVLAVSFLALLLNACGGGGGSGTASTSTVSATDVYVVPCAGDTSNGPAGESNQGTVTVTTTAGSNVTNLSLHYQYYDGSTNCTAGTLNVDTTVTGQISDKGTTKNYLDEFGAPVTAKVATFTYNGLTLAKGNLVNVTIPTAGATTDVAYAMVGNKLYVSKGRRGTDGLGDALARPATKQ